MEGFILEEPDVFAQFIDPNGKDLTSKFMQFADMSNLLFYTEFVID
jgi:hypothetical protein